MSSSMSIPLPRGEDSILLSPRGPGGLSGHRTARSSAVARGHGINPAYPAGSACTGRCGRRRWQEIEPLVISPKATMNQIPCVTSQNVITR
jgi:hypothetical protein